MDTILVLNFGGQYAHLIGRRIREKNVYSKVVPCDISLEDLKEFEEDHEIKGIVLSGGPSSVFEENAPKINKELLDYGVPILGICYGHQLIANTIGGEVTSAKTEEYGIIVPKIKKKGELLKDVEDGDKGWTSHGDAVKRLPSDFKVLASTDNCPVAAFEHRQKDIYGIQWHPEVTHTEHGDKIFENFLFDICNCNKNWKMEDFAENKIEEIKEKVGDSNCLIAMSGGVDSSTAALLASKAIGNQLKAVFVDHGFMRKKEPEKISEIFENFEMDFIFREERDRFLKKIENVTDPEKKRKIIGEEFIRVFEEVAKEYDAEYLIQGTIYPDWIESGSEDQADLIKSHHNVGGLPSKLDFKGVIEPLRDLYKDEVRDIASKKGLPDNIVHRQPYPGPGLAVRMIGDITKEKLDILKDADHIFTEEIEDAGLDKEYWQYFAVLMESQTTGVKGDSRDYGNTIALRAVKSKEAMTASFGKIPYNLLEKISTRITNEVPEVTRVVYDITHKPPATIEWE